MRAQKREGAAIPTHIPGLRPRLIAVAIFVAGWLAIFAAIAAFGWAATWNALSVPSLSPGFADMRSVQASIDTARQGLDPHAVNPGDPWHRAMDYPRVWTWLATTLALDSERHYLLFEVVLVGGFLLSVIGLLRRAPSAWLLVAAFSSSVLLLVERGNNDALVFALVYLAAVAPAALGLGLLFVAASLKIYPVLCWPALVRSRATLALAAALAVALLFVLQGEFGDIFHAQPLRGYLSYGSASFAQALRTGAHVVVPAVAITGFLVALALTLLLFLPGRISFARGADHALRRRLFYAGAAVFLGTFVLGSNWDYRLSFLLFCVPLLATLERAALRRALLVCLVLALNHSALGALGGIAGTLVNELAKAALFVALAAVTTVVVAQDERVHTLWKRVMVRPGFR
jgi:hypothetical protein